jgi:hypothetical protein
MRSRDLYRVFTAWIAATMLIAVAIGVSVRADDHAGLDPAEADRLVQQLGSDRFADRNAAMRRLEGLQGRAIPLLIEAVERGDFEMQQRSLALLGRLATSEDLVAGDAALEALRSLAGQREGASLALLQESLSQVEEQRFLLAADMLRGYGAEVTVRDVNGVAAPALHFGKNWRGSERQMGLSRRLAGVQFVSIEESTLGDEALEPLSRLAETRKLYLGKSRISGRELERLASLENLEHLSLRGVPVTDELLAMLPPLPSLQGLGLDATRVTNAGLSQLTAYPSLRTLWLDGTAITAEGLPHLRALPDLASLYLPETDISGPGLESLKDLPKLQSVSFKGCKLTVDDMERLSGLAQVEVLGLDHTNITDEHLARLDDLPRLRLLWLSKTAVSDASVEKISQFKGLRTLYLHGSAVSEHGANQLKAALPNCQVLR